MPLIHDETDEKGGDITVHPQSSVPSWDPLSVGWAAVKGAGKEAVGMVENIPGIGSMPSLPKGTDMLRWSESKDQEHPIAEQAGRLGADVAPMFALPEVEVAEGIANTFNIARRLPTYYKYGIPKAASALDKLFNWGYKGAVGGASQAPQDRTTGARVGMEAGIGTQLLQKAVRQGLHNPRGSLPYLAALAALAYQERGRMSPYLTYHAGMTLPGVAAGIAPFMPPGVAGALGERAAQGTGYDRANQPPKPPNDSDEIVNEK